MTDYDRRLDRIEGKLDKLAEIMTSVVRVEEKMAAGSERLVRLEKTVDQHDADIDELKAVSALNSNYVKGAERLLWMLVSAGIALGTYYVR